MNAEAGGSVTPLFRIVRTAQCRAGTPSTSECPPTETPPGLLHITTTAGHGDNIVVLALEGAIVADTCTQLEDALSQILRGTPRRIVIMATDVTHMDRAGMTVLANAAERADEWDLPLAIGDLPDQCHRLILTAGFRRALQPTQAAAMRSVSERYLAGEPTRVELLQLIATLTSAGDPHVGN